jgi:hypothetical protein
VCWVESGELTDGFVTVDVRMSVATGHLVVVPAMLCLVGDFVVVQVDHMACACSAWFLVPAANLLFATSVAPAGTSTATLLATTWAWMCTTPTLWARTARWSLGW